MCSWRDVRYAEQLSFYEIKLFLFIYLKTFYVLSLPILVNKIVY